jgi:hypothetical protein
MLPGSPTSSQILKNLQIFESQKIKLCPVSIKIRYDTHKFTREIEKPSYPNKKNISFLTQHYGLNYQPDKLSLICRSR